MEEMRMHLCGLTNRVTNWLTDGWTEVNNRDASASNKQNVYLLLDITIKLMFYLLHLFHVDLEDTYAKIETCRHIK